MATGHGLVGRAVPADVADAAGVAAGHEAGLDVRRLGVDDDRDAPDQLGALALLQLAEERAVHRDDPRGAVGDERAALVVDDQAALRLDDDVAHRLVGGLRLVGLAADDLEVVEPDEERREQREDQRLHDHQAQPALVAPGRWSLPSRRGPLRAEPCEELHQRREHERGQQHVPHDGDQDDLEEARRPTCPGPGAARRRARRATWPTNDAAATVPTTARAVGFCVLAHAGGEERRDRQGERPAAGDVVGRRREVEGEAGGEAEHAARTAPRRSARPRPRRAGRGWARCRARRRAGRA